MLDENFDGFATQSVSGMWSLICTPINILHPLPFQIGDGIVIERASPQLRDQMRKLLIESLGNASRTILRGFETDAQQDQDDATITNFHNLPMEDWRYYVVSTDDLGTKAMQFQHAAAVTDTPLDILSLSIYKGRNAHSHRPTALIGQYWGSPGVPMTLTENELTELSSAYLSLQTVSAAHPQVARAHQLLENLAFIPQHSDFHIIGLFAIVEMLITHSPSGDGDSISRQIRTKLPLLFRRFASPIKIEEYFGMGTEKTVWNALYAFRSAIAHGAAADFTRGDLKVLKSREVALGFLRVVVRRLVRFAHEEPFLLKDLSAV